MGQNSRLLLKDGTKLGDNVLLFPVRRFVPERFQDLEVGVARGLWQAVEKAIDLGAADEEKIGQPGDRFFVRLAHTFQPAPHSSATLGMNPVVSGARPIKRLAPQPDVPDSPAQLRAGQPQENASPDTPSTRADPFMMLVLLGGLSITAIAGALLLGVLWLVGWPP